MGNSKASLIRVLLRGSSNEPVASAAVAGIVSEPVTSHAKCEPMANSPCGESALAVSVTSPFGEVPTIARVAVAVCRRITV